MTNWNRHKYLMIIKSIIQNMYVARFISVIASGVFCLLFVLLLAGSLSTKTRWGTPGILQILTNDKISYVFYQINTWEHRPGLFVSAPNIIVEWRQGLIIAENNKLQEMSLDSNTLPRFDCSVTKIWHSQNDNKVYAVTNYNSGMNREFFQLVLNPSPHFTRAEVRNIADANDVQQIEKILDSSADFFQLEGSQWKSISIDFDKLSVSNIRQKEFSVLVKDRSILVMRDERKLCEIMIKPDSR